MESTHFEHSTFREKLLEHLFVGEVLRHLWRQGITSVEVLKPEVDNGGYDLVIACHDIMRHIQLKSSHSGARAAYQKVNLKLADKPSGCIVWLFFDPKTLKLGPFRWFGGPPRSPLPAINNFRKARHTKGNAQGIKNWRPNIRLVPKSKFDELADVSEVVDKLSDRVGSWLLTVWPPWKGGSDIAQGCRASGYPGKRRENDLP